MSPAQKLGLKWENRLLAFLAKSYQVSSHSGWNDEIDLTVDDVCQIHIKAARIKQHDNGQGYIRNRYQFNFGMVNSGHIVIAVCAGINPVHFIIPTLFLKPALSITSDPRFYNGWAAEFRERWDLIEKAVRECKEVERVF